MDRKFEEWCAAVTAQVRFRPDYGAIEKELAAHYEDHVKDLERVGYPGNLARERALQAMGDPVEVGQALDKAHKPWLGWLWQASRYLVLTLAAAIVVLAFLDRGDWTLLRRTQDQLAWTDPPAYAEWVEVNGSTLYLAPGDITEADGHFQADIHLWIKMHSLSDSGPKGLMGYLEIRDDQGSLLSWRTRNEDGTWPETGYREVIDVTDGWTRYQWNIRLHLDHRPAWAEVSYPYDGQDWVLRAEWRNGT